MGYNLSAFTTGDGYFDGDTSKLSKDLAIWLISNGMRCPTNFCGNCFFMDNTGNLSDSFKAANDAIKQQCIQYLVDNKHEDLIMEILL